MILKSIASNAARLSLFALAGACILAGAQWLTAEKIAHNREQALLNSLQRVIPDTLHDNILSSDQITLPSTEHLHHEEPHTVYIARKDNRPTAIVLESVAPRWL